jgi:hypothetical protein
MMVIMEKSRNDGDCEEDVQSGRSPSWCSAYTFTTSVLASHQYMQETPVAPKSTLRSKCTCYDQ